MLLACQCIYCIHISYIIMMCDAVIRTVVLILLLIISPKFIAITIHWTYLIHYIRKRGLPFVLGNLRKCV